MDVILHVGAHRTGCGSLRDYVSRHAPAFDDQGIAFWGPASTGFGSRPSQIAAGEALGRAKSELARLRAGGKRLLFVSDADMIGSIADCVDRASLYPNVQWRMSLISALFEGEVRRILFSPRSLALFWSSALAAGIKSGSDVPSRRKAHAIAMSRRGWRDVIADIAAAMPQAEIRVLPFEDFAGRPEALLSRGAGIEGPMDNARVWLNRAPTLPDLRRALGERGQDPAALPFGMGRWNPFTPKEHAALREMQADDMMWLIAGADGLAKLIEDGCSDRAGQTLPDAAHRKGHKDEFEKRDLAQPRRG